MIRLVTPDDSAAVIGLAVAAGLFPAEDTAILDTMMTDYFSVKFNEGHVCLIDEDAAPRGVAYYEPAPATDRTWYLTMIAVRPDVQGRGYGAALMQAMEEDLQAKAQRLILVETSGLPSFELTRLFYKKCGYEEEARIRDYYTTGEDMVVFRKALNAR